MTGWIWAVAVVTVVVLLGLAVAGTYRLRRDRLRHRFGPEYDRVIGQADGRRAGESQLARRARRRAQLIVVALPEEARQAYVTRWQTAQEEFVDRPGEAVATAELLLHRVMAECGYPVGDFEEQADLVSVDHPDVVEDYRVAHQIRQRHEAGRATTDDLREALLRYRSVFDGLLRPRQGQAVEEPERAPDERPRTVAAAVRPMGEDGEEQP